MEKFEEYLRQYIEIDKQKREIDMEGLDEITSKIEDMESKVKTLNKVRRSYEFEQKMDRSEKTELYQEKIAATEKEISECENSISEYKANKDIIEKNKKQYEKLGEHQKTIKENAKKHRDSSLAEIKKIKRELDKEKKQKSKQPEIDGLIEDIKNETNKEIENYRGFLASLKDSNSKKSGQKRIDEIAKEGEAKIAQLLKQKQIHEAKIESEFLPKIEELSNQEKEIKEAYKKIFNDFGRVDRGENVIVKEEEIEINSDKPQLEIEQEINQPGQQEGQKPEQQEEQQQDELEQDEPGQQEGQQQDELEQDEPGQQEGQQQDELEQDGPEQQEGQKPEQQEEQKPDGQEKPKQNDNYLGVKIQYYANTNEYVLTDIATGKKSDPISRNEINADKYKDELIDKHGIDVSIVEKFVDVRIYSILKNYDKMFKTNTSKQYIETATNMSMSKKDRKNIMKDYKIELNYNLKGIDGVDEEQVELYNEEERMEIFAEANKLSKTGLGVVKKGFIARLQEIIDRFKFSNKIHKETKLLKAAKKKEEKQNELLNAINKADQAAKQKIKNTDRKEKDRNKLVNEYKVDEETRQRLESTVVDYNNEEKQLEEEKLNEYLEEIHGKVESGEISEENYRQELLECIGGKDEEIR